MSSHAIWMLINAVRGVFRMSRKKRRHLCGGSELFARYSPDGGLVAACFRSVACVGLLLPLWSLAAEFDNEYDEKPWSEVEVRIPSFPEPGNMIPFTVGAVTDSTFLIDSESLSVGADDVIRYTLEVVSPSGAKNVSYEGMRCKTAERRFYAFGRNDGTWSKARGNQWTRIGGTSNNHHVELFSNYFCPPGSPAVGSADEARQALRSGGQHAVRIR